MSTELVHVRFTIAPGVYRYNVIPRGIAELAVEKGKKVEIIDEVSVNVNFDSLGRIEIVRKNS